jgi:hypothetical protein
MFLLQMKVGVPSKKNQQVRVGETVEVLILSDIKSLSRFMAVRDVYLPSMDLWLSEEPCIERPVFESLIETLRADPSSSALKSRDTQAVKGRLPDSVDMIPGTSLGTEPQSARRWRVAELDYEEVPNEFEDDPKLQALRRLGQRQNDREFPRRVQTSSRMLDYSSDSEDFWEPANDGNEAEASVNDEDYIPVGAFDDDTKLQDRKERELPRSLRADAYGPPMQYMRMQDYGSDVNRREQDISKKNAVGASAQPESFEDDDAERADDTVDSEQAEQLTTVDEFLGSGLDKMRTRESEDVELVQEEEV